MTTTTAPDAFPRTGVPVSDRPEIDACETCPGTQTFIASDNTHGWIATDHVVPVRR